MDNIRQYYTPTYPNVTFHIQFKGIILILMSHQVKPTSGQLALLHIIVNHICPAGHLCPISYFQKKEMQGHSQGKLIISSEQSFRTFKYNTLHLP